MQSGSRINTGTRIIDHSNKKVFMNLLYQMFFWIFIIRFLILPSWIESVQVGFINDVILSSPAALTIPMNNSCAECICTMMLVTNIKGLSCVQNQTCLLFYNYSLHYTLRSSPNSSFHFLALPPEQQYSTAEATENTQMVMTTTVSSAICNANCTNGGTCISPFNCSCVANMWTGDYCQIPVCSPNCQNNGTCSIPGVCNCTSEWTGAQCEVPLCSPQCQNSGNCTSPGVCTCYYGWTGAYCQTITTILWSFDNILNDLSGHFIGIGMHSPTFTSGINGYGLALVLKGASGQCVIVSPYLNMSYISFTWEFWVYPTITPAGDSMFIGQCTQPSRDQCLIFMTRNDKMWFAFWADDVVGPTFISANRWSHMAFVYDLSANKKFIYLNGILEATQNSTGSLQVRPTNMTFGCLTTNQGGSYGNFFTGYIDQMLYNSRIKNASEILDDATLVAYFRFLSTEPLIDSDANYINGSWGGGAITIASGIINQAIEFPVSGSYFQLTGLVLLGTSNRPLSLSLWFRINSLNGSNTIVYLSSTYNSTAKSCIEFIRLLANASIQIQIYNGTVYNVIVGPIMRIGSWNHIVYTFSTTNGMSLYINGSLYRSAMTSYSASGTPRTLTFGNPTPGTYCDSLFPNQQFYGSIDEVRLYSRELTASEILQQYANP